MGGLLLHGVTACNIPSPPCFNLKVRPSAINFCCLTDVFYATFHQIAQNCVQIAVKGGFASTLGVHPNTLAYF